MQALPETRGARLTDDRGFLEITMPSEFHESSSEWIGIFVRVLVGEMGLKLKSLCSTTFNRADLNRGAEPDCAYYIPNQTQVVGRDYDGQTWRIFRLAGTEYQEGDRSPTFPVFWPKPGSVKVRPNAPGGNGCKPSSNPRATLKRRNIGSAQTFVRFR
ncbi:MAG: hypothetical protein ACUVSQ_09980 [Pseudanabaenaceae cyanobacterium]